MATIQPEEIRPESQTSTPTISSSLNAGESPNHCAEIISFHSDMKSLPIPNSYSIKLGTRVKVNYAGYHLHPWEYFQNPNKKPDDPDLSPNSTYADAWRRLVLDDNEELLPPTLDADIFEHLRNEYEGNNENNNRMPGNFNHTRPEYLDPELQLFSRKYRWEQEKKIIEKMYTNIEGLFKKDFHTLQKHEVINKNLDRVVYHLYVQKMRLEVRKSEIQDMMEKLGLKEQEGTIQKDIEDIGNKLKKFDENLKIVSVEDKQKLDVQNFENEKSKMSDKIHNLNAEIKEFKEKLEDKLLTEWLKYVGKMYEKIIELTKNTPDWKMFKNMLKEGSWLKKQNLLLKLQDSLREIPILEVQDLENRINSMKSDLLIIEREVKALDKRIVSMNNSLLLLLDEIKVKIEDSSGQNKGNQGQQGKASPTTSDVNKKQGELKEKTQDSSTNIPETTLTIDELNVYLRYPPIENELVLHEGFWPPLKVLKSEFPVSVSLKEKQIQIQLSDVIGRFDEAFTEFSSTLADHGMPRPTPQPRPITFRYGLGEVIPAWDHPKKGISDMELGEIRIMICPSSTAYGEKGVPSKVPPFMPLLYIIRMDAIYNLEELSDESDGEAEATKSI